MKDQLKTKPSEKLLDVIVSHIKFKEIGARYVAYDADNVKFQVGRQMYELKIREINNKNL